jgi:tRNA(fMet)-specific endonuclease VapC
VFLLDTDVCIDLLRHQRGPLASHLVEQRPTDVFISTIVRAELLFGARRSRRVAENLSLVERFLAPFTSLSFDEASADQYGLIRAELAGSGTPIGPNDLLIAASARAHDLTLVTRNRAEFGRVGGLRVVDWSVP